MLNLPFQLYRWVDGSIVAEVNGIVRPVQDPQSLTQYGYTPQTLSSLPYHPATGMSGPVRGGTTGGAMPLQNLISTAQGQQQFGGQVQQQTQTPTPTSDPSRYLKVRTETGYDIYDAETGHKYTWEELSQGQNALPVNVDHIQETTSDKITKSVGTQQSTGDPTYDAILNSMEGVLSRLEQRGKALNPYVDITPDKVAEFLAQSKKEISPYYESQLKIAQNDLLKAAGFSRAQIAEKEQEYALKYGTAFRQIGEQAAEQGFAQSGLRQRGERELAEETQRGIESGRRASGYQIGKDVSQFAQQYGYGAIPELGTMQEAPRAFQGEPTLQKPERQLPYYEISPSVYEGLIGSKQQEQIQAERTRASELEGAYRSGEILKKQRELTL